MKANRNKALLLAAAFALFGSAQPASAKGCNPPAPRLEYPAWVRECAGVVQARWHDSNPYGLPYGEYERIIERRSFSLLDMKRFVTALGLESGGYKGEFEDLVKQGQPAIVPISYAGFKHFVVYKGYKDGRVYVADPALGNISFDEQRFKDVWENNTLFLINVPTEMRKNMLALQEADLRHVDDATVNRYALVDIQYPQHYMEKIADRASTIRLERNKNKESEYYGQPTYNFLRLYGFVAQRFEMQSAPN